MKGLPVYVWSYKARAKIWFKKHVIRPLLRVASEHRWIAGRRRV